MEKEKSQDEWLNHRITRIKTEAAKLLEQINEWEENNKHPYPSPGPLAAIKRTTLDLGKEGAKLRAGWWRYLERREEIKKNSQK